MKSVPRKAGKKKSSAAAATENEDAETLERLRLRFERELEAPILRALIPEEFATSEHIRGPIMAPYPHDGTSKMRPARFVCIFDPKQPLPVESSIGKETQTPVLFFGEDHDKIYWVNTASLAPLDNNSEVSGQERQQMEVWNNVKVVARAMSFERLSSMADICAQCANSTRGYEACTQCAYCNHTFHNDCVDAKFREIPNKEANSDANTINEGANNSNKSNGNSNWYCHFCANPDKWLKLSKRTFDISICHPYTLFAPFPWAKDTMENYFEHEGSSFAWALKELDLEQHLVPPQRRKPALPGKRVKSSEDSGYDVLLRRFGFHQPMAQSAHYHQWQLPKVYVENFRLLKLQMAYQGMACTKDESKSWYANEFCTMIKELSSCLSVYVNKNARRGGRRKVSTQGAASGGEDDDDEEEALEMLDKEANKKKRGRVKPFKGNDAAIEGLIAAAESPRRKSSSKKRGDASFFFSTSQGISRPDDSIPSSLPDVPFQDGVLLQRKRTNALSLIQRGNAGEVMKKSSEEMLSALIGTLDPETKLPKVFIDAVREYLGTVLPNGGRLVGCKLTAIDMWCVEEEVDRALFAEDPNLPSKWTLQQWQSFFRSSITMLYIRQAVRFWRRNAIVDVSSFWGGMTYQIKAFQLDDSAENALHQAVYFAGAVMANNRECSLVYRLISANKPKFQNGTCLWLWHRIKASELLGFLAGPGAVTLPHISPYQWGPGLYFGDDLAERLEDGQADEQDYMLLAKVNVGDKVLEVDPRNPESTDPKSNETLLVRGKFSVHVNDRNPRREDVAWNLNAMPQATGLASAARSSLYIVRNPELVDFQFLLQFRKRDSQAPHTNNEERALGLDVLADVAFESVDLDEPKASASAAKKMKTLSPTPTPPRVDTAAPVAVEAPAVAPAKATTGTKRAKMEDDVVETKPKTPVLATEVASPARSSKKKLATSTSPRSDRPLSKSTEGMKKSTTPRDMVPVAKIAVTSKMSTIEKKVRQIQQLRRAAKANAVVSARSSAPVGFTLKQEDMRKSLNTQADRPAFGTRFANTPRPPPQPFVPSPTVPATAAATATATKEKEMENSRLANALKELKAKKQSQNLLDSNLTFRSPERAEHAPVEEEIDYGGVGEQGIAPIALPSGLCADDIRKLQSGFDEAVEKGPSSSQHSGNSNNGNANNNVNNNFSNNNNNNNNNNFANK